MTDEPLAEDGEAPLAAELEEVLEAPTEAPDGPTETCGTLPPPPPVEIDGTGPTCGVCTDGTLGDVTEPDPLEPTDGGGGVLTEGVRREGVEIVGALPTGVDTDGTVTDGTCTDGTLRAPAEPEPSAHAVTTPTTNSGPLAHLRCAAARSEVGSVRRILPMPINIPASPPVQAPFVDVEDLPATCAFVTGGSGPVAG